ncbi:hypothetical protein CVT26_015186 [Gymnopilus dilepis]|uniref:Uncharacterized protein n=1 Tax=Gymnopilus dilepis TaxID=231916 RepID=A0A409W9Z8_9AGAR|nr:hypothetical protein CVT26_015186 [Gymnopilus dilepis]
MPFDDEPYLLSLISILYIVKTFWVFSNGTVSFSTGRSEQETQESLEQGAFAQRFARKYKQHVDVYLEMSDQIKCFDNDFRYFEIEPDKIVDLAKAMIAAAGPARSDDISSLKCFALVCTAECEDNGKLDTPIHPAAPKTRSRGFNQPQLARLLTPVKLISDFDKDPKEFIKGVGNGTIKIRAKHMPSFLWPRDEYDPHDLEYEMFRNRALLMTYNHIFTSPSSAMPGHTKTQSSQAKLHRMTSVTAPSIAYVCQQYRYAISAIDDWRHDERLFKREEFYDQVLKILYKDLIEWLNAEILGIDPRALDESDNEEGPSTATMIQQQREARRAAKTALKALAQSAQGPDKPAAQRLSDPSLDHGHSPVPLPTSSLHATFIPPPPPPTNNQHTAFIPPPAPLVMHPISPHPSFVSERTSAPYLERPPLPTPQPSQLRRDPRSPHQDLGYSRHRERAPEGNEQSMPPRKHAMFSERRVLYSPDRPSQHSPPKCPWSHSSAEVHPPSKKSKGEERERDRRRDVENQFPHYSHRRNSHSSRRMSESQPTFGVAYEGLS